MTPITTEQWIEGLEDGKFVQTFFHWGTYRGFPATYKHCAVSVALELAGSVKIHFDDGTFRWGGDIAGAEYLVDYPEELMCRFVPNARPVPGVVYNGTLVSVASLNDFYRLPFKEIAALIRKSVAACRLVE